MAGTGSVSIGAYDYHTMDFVYSYSGVPTNVYLLVDPGGYTVTKSPGSGSGVWRISTLSPSTKYVISPCRITL